MKIRKVFNTDQRWREKKRKQPAPRKNDGDYDGEISERVQRLPPTTSLPAKTTVATDAQGLPSTGLDIFGSYIPTGTSIKSNFAFVPL